MSPPFHATLEQGEAVLRFPYDERLRTLLRAIPGRRWDPQGRAWCVPLEPEPAEALARLLAELPEPEVSEALSQAIERRRRKRRRGECVVERVRPDAGWWLGFATDGDAELLEALMEHPDAYGLPVIGRAQIPLDELAVRMVGELNPRFPSLRLSEDARLALVALREQARREAAGSGGADGPGGRPGSIDAQGREAVGDWPGDHGSEGAGFEGAGSEEERRRERAAAARLDAMDEVALCRDRRGGQWILLAAVHTPLARVLAERAGLRGGEGPAGTYALAAVAHDAPQIAELLDQLEAGSVDPRVSAWLERATEWRGNIEVGGSGEEPVFLLLGDPDRLPGALRERASTVPGGAAVPLTLESWRLMDGRLRGWLSQPRRGAASRRCARDARRRPRCWSAPRSTRSPRSCSRPATTPRSWRRSRTLAGALPPKPRRGADAGHEHARLPAIRADPFCVPELDAFLAEHEDVGGSRPRSTLLQEVREEHARAAGLVALSAATEASTRGARGWRAS